MRKRMRDESEKEMREEMEIATKKEKEKEHSTHLTDHAAERVRVSGGRKTRNTEQEEQKNKKREERELGRARCDKLSKQSRRVSVSSRCSFA